ncbi:bacillithiol biosynthesis cysteine-adding enzyme BshC [Cytophagaceae bacterium ABcell3]|nr:bacillithiol biosynthesis cysteine-adding enzyme BshC [Cytophagaceae bacterium ABcell3]
MQLKHLSVKDTGCFSSLFTDYIDKSEALKPFYGIYPELENFEDIIRNRSFSPEIRQDLTKVLEEQYSGLTLPKKLEENLGQLKKENTYTVTTGHQLNLLTGPLYFIYKILTTIKLAESLSIKYPDSNFVPVYWMATEDHDFAEINHFNLFGQTYTWNKEAHGAVGRLNTRGLEELLKDVPDLPENLKHSYTESRNLAEATRKLVTHLFGDKGLVTVNADHAVLKKHMKTLIVKELELTSVHDLVSGTSMRLSETGYNAQAHVREINLFWLSGSIRERIIREEDRFKVANTSLNFSLEEIMKMAEEKPECFSPNVLTRPVYQEQILPNLAYIGGPAELAYWMQLKDAFNHLDTSFPVLFPRSVAMVINKNTNRKLLKTGIQPEDLFLKPEDILEKYVYSKSGEEFSTENEVAQVNKMFEQLQERAVQTDKSLEQFVLAQRQRILSVLSDTEKKIRNAGKKRFETEVNQVQNILDKLFPNGGLQERHENFLNFYINDHSFIEKLYNNFDPFDFRFKIFIEHE